MCAPVRVCVEGVCVCARVCGQVSSQNSLKKRDLCFSNLKQHGLHFILEKPH